MTYDPFTMTYIGLSPANVESLPDGTAFTDHKGMMHVVYNGVAHVINDPDIKDTPPRVLYGDFVESFGPVELDEV